jgi:hypothetical protein
MRTFGQALAVSVSVVFVLGPPSAHAQEAPTPVDRALLDRYCVTCHNSRLRTGGLSLDDVDVTQVAAHADILEKVVRKLRAGQMPPPRRPRPEPAVTEAFVASLETALDSAAAANPNPGRVAVHRMNRLEYLNVINDLLGLEIDPSMLPVDDPGIGFDNNADVLSVTPALMARYLSAATKISRIALGNPQAIRPSVSVYRTAEFGFQDDRAGEDMPFGTHGGLGVRHVFPLDGVYVFKVRLYRNAAGDTIRGLDYEHEVQVRVDHDLVERFLVGGEYPGHDPGQHNAIPEDDVEGQRLHTYRLTADDHMELRMPVKAGARLVAVAFTDRAPRVSESVPLKSTSRQHTVATDDAGTPSIDTLQISGPFDGTLPENTPTRERLFSCRPTTVQDHDSCAREILSALALKAYRRPLMDADVEELMGLFTIGSEEGSFDDGIELALEGLLSSPSFLFRVGHDPEDTVAGDVYRLSDLELASRLSFFLWKSLPDEELLNLAEQGQLSNPAVLTEQTERLLADPKATRWVNDFMEQWLTVRNIRAHQPDFGLFRHYDENLRDAMERETRLFFESQVRDDRSALDLLDADYTFVNARLARHYGIPDVYGSHFRRVPVTDPSRRGLLGHGSILMLTSYADRTSVVLRGKWVLETLLGAPPPPPPPQVPDLEENEPGEAPKSLRERMERHRANPVCAACHAPMDPFGFVLENFDATGRWRETDDGAAIDASATLTDGGTISGPEELGTYLSSRGDEVIHTVTEKLFSYALGRGLEYYDAPTVRQLIRDAADDEYRWSSLVHGIVRSMPFQMRRVSDN